jgi:hypothetical protein
MTSYTPSTYYNADGTVASSANVGRLTQYDTSDEIHFHVSGNVNRRFKFTISTNTWSDAHASNSNPFALSDGLTSTTPSTFGGDVSGTPQPAIIGMCESTGGSVFGGFANPFYTGSSGAGPNTLGAATDQWSASFTKNPGNDYWRWNVTGYNTEATDYIALYDYLPTLSSTDPPIGIRTFAASSSPTSQYGLFIPDKTKTYYIINYLSGTSSTNLNQQVLATKNFANKKVFCNFW